MTEFDCFVRYQPFLNILPSMIDENTLFREVTLRICSNLDIETALWHCFLYLEKHIPLHDIYLTYYDRKLGTIRFYAKADQERGERLDIHIPFPVEIRKKIENKEFEEILLINQPEHHVFTRQVKNILKVHDFSTLLMSLKIGEMRIGTAVFIALEINRFSEKHLHLMSLLNEPFAIALSNSLRYQEVLELKELLSDDNRYLRNELQKANTGKIIGTLSGLRQVMKMVAQVAPLTSPVLLLGETGVGKEMIANAIHTQSKCKDGPFIKVNCGAIPAGVIDSELFGHEKGAFTGALAQKRGRFERADGGTIFLDEIGELDAAAQVRLLRVLQEKEIERVGGTSPIRVNIRVIAATHRNLEKMVAEGTFREDLYYRLKVFPMVIPPVSERKSDIPALVEHFIQKKARELQLSGIPTVAPADIDQLMEHDWPGNVREIENTVERAMILSRGNPLNFNFLEIISKENGQKHNDIDKRIDKLGLDEAMFQHIRQALTISEGKIGGKNGAAQILKMHPSTLRHRMRKLGIEFGRKIIPKKIK